MNADDGATARAVIDRFWQGWEALDASAILSTIAERDDVVLVGTDADEYWVGHHALVEPFEAMVRAFDEERIRWADGDPIVCVAGDTAWAVGRLSVTVRTGAEVVRSDLRATFILERAADGWSIAHAHFSVAPASPMAAY